MMLKATLFVLAAGITLGACARETHTTTYPANGIEPSSDSDADRVPSPASNNIGGSAADTTDGPAPVTNPPGNPLVPNGGTAATGPTESRGNDRTSPMTP
jgi:hypothetical protein